MYLTNAFSINMLPLEDEPTIPFEHIVHFSVVSEAEVQNVSGELVSAIGHPALATLLSARLGCDVSVNRVSLEFGRGSTMIVAQATMPRLAEGQILSEDEMKNIPIVYWKVSSEK